MYFPTSLINTGMATFFLVVPVPVPVLYSQHWKYWQDKKSEGRLWLRLGHDKPLVCKKYFFPSESLLHEPPSTDLLTIVGGTEDRRFSLKKTAIDWFWLPIFCTHDFDFQFFILMWVRGDDIMYLRARGRFPACWGSGLRGQRRRLRYLATDTKHR